MLLNPFTARVLRVLLIWVLAWPFVVLAEPTVQSSQKTEQQLQKLRDSMAELRSQLNAAKSEYKDLMQSLETSEKEIGTLNKKVESLQGQLKDKQSQLRKLKQERLALEGVKAENAEAVKQHVRAAYRMGQHSDLKILLGQEDPTHLKRNLRYYNYIVEARKEKINALARNIKRINQIEPQIESETNAIASSSRQLSQKRDQLKKSSVTRKQTLATLDKLIKGKDAEYAQLEEDQSRLEKLLNKVSQLTEDLLQPIQSGGSIHQLKGKLPWPTKGTLTASYGSNRAGRNVTWQGILIQSQSGQPVQSIHHGRVVFSDYLRGQGLLIIVDHGDNVMTLYAHNQSLFKSVGDWVSAGETIASVGNSGGKQSAQLYFEIRKNGQPINPSHWLKRA